jgi:phosphoribosylaminoimidazole carboxylase (NCAIR synthetase)
VALGGNELNAGLQQVARRRGARLLVVDWNDTPGFPGNRHLCLDIKESDAVLAALRPLMDRVAFAYTSSDVATETVARIHAERGLLRPPAAALAAARHKPSMNAIWERRGLLDKRFRACRSLDEMTTFCNDLCGDLIIKPAAASSSQGITVLLESDRGDPQVARLGQPEQHVSAALAWDRASRVDPQGEVLVEEFVHGTEYTVEMLGDGHGHVQVWAISRKSHSANAGRSRIASKLHYNPRELSRPHQQKIARFARQCFRALGLHTCLGHLEVIERPTGELVPIELGARSSGFVATHLVDAISEQEPTLLGEYESVLRGGEVPDALMRHRRSSMYFFYDLPPGVGRRSGTSLMQFLPPAVRSLACDRSKLRPGSRFAQIDSDYDRHGYEILVGDSDALTIDAVERAETAHRTEFLASPIDAAKSAAAAPAPVEAIESAAMP